MYLEIALVAILFLLSITNSIIYRKKPNIIVSSVGVFVSLLYLLFVFIDVLKPYSWIYGIVVAILITSYSFFFMPKKVTKNITEYDYFELEKTYLELKDDREKLRQRFLSTITLVNEGIVFYENGNKDVILSDYAHEVFGGKQNTSLEEHAKIISDIDREDYLKTIDRVSKHQMTYEIKYRIVKNGISTWILEKGHFIGVESKRSIIATIMPLDINCYKKTSYFDVDSLKPEEKMYPVLKELTEDHKSFTFITIELTNIKDINEKYSREIGNLMMNDYIRYLKNLYQPNINKFFRISGIRFVMIIDDYRTYEEFHRSVTSTQSELYNIKMSVSGIKDVVRPKFGIVNVTGVKSVDSLNLYKLGIRLLEEAIESNRRNYSIFGE